MTTPGSTEFSEDAAFRDRPTNEWRVIDSSECHSRSRSSSDDEQCLFPRLLGSYILHGFYCKHLSLNGDCLDDEISSQDSSPECSTSSPLGLTETTATTRQLSSSNEIALDSLLRSLGSPNDSGAQSQADGLVSKSFSFLHSPFELRSRDLRSIVSPMFRCFYAVKAPKQAFDQYLMGLYQSTPHIGAEVFVLATAVLWRVSRMLPVCSRSLHRMYLTALLLCQKAVAEGNTSLTAIAEAGGIGAADLVVMERRMFAVLDFDLFGGHMTKLYVDLVYSLRVHCQLQLMSHAAWIAAAWSESTKVLPMP